MLWKKDQLLKNRAYRIEEVLGQGRFSITYLAYEVRTKNRVAIKTLNPDAPMLQDMKPREREAYADKFWNEALILERCKHPHIVKVIDIFDERIKDWFAATRYPCIVMEYIDGIDLGRRGEPQLPSRIALRYIQQIGSALIAVHSHNLLHRDLKPGNIMICTREGKSMAILIDFGLARAFDHPLTQQITVNGYAPFELYSKNEPKGTWTDVYGLAATLYVLLTGEPPEDALKRHDKDNDVHLTPPIQRNPKISKHINKAIIKALALMPGDRTQTVAEFLHELGIIPWYMSFPQWDVNVWVNIVIAIGTLIAATVAVISLLR
jgi:serine/threonine protein kinase